MKLDINEIIGLNTLLDGEKIWGFPETADKTEKDYVEKTAQKIMSRGKKQTDCLLSMLEQYKKAGTYLSVNHINAAETENGWILLAREDKAYHLFFMEHDILETALRKEIGLFHKMNEEIKDVKPEKTDFLELVKKNHERLGRCVFLCRYVKRKMKEFHIVYEMDGKRNVYDRMKQESWRAGDAQIEELIRRYMGTWE